MWSILVNVPYKLEKNVYSASLNEIIDYVTYIQLMDGALAFNYVLTDFLPAGSVHTSNRGQQHIPPHTWPHRKPSSTSAF